MSTLVTPSSISVMQGGAEVTAALAFVCAMAVLVLLATQDIATGTDTPFTLRIRKATGLGLVPLGVAFLLLAGHQLATLLK